MKPTNKLSQPIPTFHPSPKDTYTAPEPTTKPSVKTSIKPTMKLSAKKPTKKPTKKPSMMKTST